MNLWMKRAIGVAALGGGLLAFSAGAASAQETAADASAQIGRSTSAQVRVCSDGRMLSRLLGSCSQGGSSGSVQANRGSDRSARIQARARVPRVASGDVSVGAGRNRPRTTPVGPAPAIDPLTSSARALDSLTGSAPALDLLTGSALAPALDLLTGSTPVPAGIGVLGSGPIGSGNQVDAGIGSISPSVPVAACGNGVGLLGDASASCGANQDTSTDGTTAPPPGTAGQTATTGTIGTPGQTGTTGTSGTPGQTGTTGVTPGTSGDPAGAIPAFAPLRPLVSAGRALAFTGAASDLLATMAVALLAAGALFLRAARPAGVREGGDR